MFELSLHGLGSAGYILRAHVLHTNNSKQQVGDPALLGLQHSPQTQPCPECRKHAGNNCLQISDCFAPAKVIQEGLTACVNSLLVIGSCQKVLW
jgi:hypothetical protein